MNKKGFCGILCAIIMLGSTTEVKPIGIIKSAIIMAGAYFGHWCYRTARICNKIRDLEMACGCSPKSTTKEREKSEQLEIDIDNNLVNNGYNPFDKISSYKTLLKCMKEKEQTSANLNNCKEQILKYTSKPKYSQRPTL